MTTTHTIAIEEVGIARNLVAFATACLTGHVVTTLAVIVLNTYLWWWLAALLALIGGCVAGFTAGAWAATSGCDAVVSATSWLRRRFA